ncbi:SWIM zinc finger family protein [Nocardia sp. NBC_01377]|uniref:SWIM zinc finger family protein n=1 Tax=Nocardia sp. NBC_01377 TaxID=2903595 RepID=UPI0032494358
MTAPWTEAQVGALAPDANALSAARALGARWHETGHRDTALWGMWHGGGAPPYLTVVDLSGPAYRCSCPSRKFPCKHVLSLMLRWTAGAVPDTDTVADFAAEWIASRAKRAREPARDTAIRVPNPATARQRRARVTAGLDDLDIWLGDQVRTGLAQTDRSYRAFEAIAARMVDAQAPAVAAVLRQLPTTVATRADWPRIVLREYARLHLLIAAHRRLDELPDALGASIRTHIGYPTSAEAVRAEAPLRDRWMVLGSRTTEEERLYTRRTWLYGRNTHRWALLVDHCFGSPGFPNDVPALGAMADAHLHYYPAAAPLRALWGERHGTDEPFTTVPGASGTIAAALEAHARALGADPWLRSWPVLLPEVTPVVDDSGWRVVDSGGAALALAPSEQPWRLLGISGGHPVTLSADWTQEGLVPVSALVAGEVLDVTGERAAPRGTNSGAAVAGSGADPTSVALLGTARRSPDPARLAPPVAAAAVRLRTDPALLLLESAALRDAFERGGVPAESGDIPEPALGDPRRRLPQAAAVRLAEMLRGTSNFLPEWFDAAEPHDYRAPDALCALLLEHASGSSPWRTALLRLAGRRGQWLAARHPQWRTLSWPDIDTELDEDTWHFGGPQARRNWLARLRVEDPAAARGALIEVWPKESGPLRAELLATLEPAISPADEDLLEPALDDRRADVRRTAAGLLTLLPDSAFARRMTARAAAWLRPTTSGTPHLVIDLPEAIDAAAQRDGIVDRGVEFTYRWNGRPDVTAGRLRRLVAATPLRFWQSGNADGWPDTAELGPERWAGIGVDDRFRQPLFDGWVDAALAQGDSRWAKALFEAGVPSDAALLRRRELFALLPIEDRTRHLLRLDGSWLSEIEALLPAMGHPWPDAVANHLMLLLADRARIAAQHAGTHGASPAAHRSLLTTASVHFPVTAAPAVGALARRCDDPTWVRAFDLLADDLTHRSKMLEELQ